MHGTKVSVLVSVLYLIFVSFGEKLSVNDINAKVNTCLRVAAATLDYSIIYFQRLVIELLMAQYYQYF